MKLSHRYERSGVLHAGAFRLKLAPTHELLKRRENRLRLAQEQKTPYSNVVRIKEFGHGKVAAQLRTGKDLGANSINDLLLTK